MRANFIANSSGRLRVQFEADGTAGAAGGFGRG